MALVYIQCRKVNTYNLAFWCSGFQQICRKVTIPGKIIHLVGICTGDASNTNSINLMDSLQKLRSWTTFVVAYGI